MNQILLLGHNYHSGKSEERKRWISEELFWEVLGKSEKSDKFVRHFQGQPFRWPHTGQMLLCYLSGAFLLTLMRITGAYTKQFRKYILQLHYMFLKLL